MSSIRLRQHVTASLETFLWITGYKKHVTAATDYCPNLPIQASFIMVQNTQLYVDLSIDLHAISTQSSAQVPMQPQMHSTQ